MEEALSYGGMASFADVGADDEVHATQAFIASRQRALREHHRAATRWAVDG